jgi:hypothetical protein
MPTPPLRRLLTARAQWKTLARERNARAREREREREREHTRGRETQTERRPAAAKGSTQGLGIAELESFVSEAKAYHYGSARKGDDPSPW